MESVEATREVLALDDMANRGDRPGSDVDDRAAPRNAQVCAGIATPASEDGRWWMPVLGAEDA